MNPARLVPSTLMANALNTPPTIKENTNTNS